MTTETGASTETIRIMVEIDKHDRKEIEFHVDRVTGAEIKQRAGVSLNDDLARKHDGKLELVTNNEEITIKNGEHFFVFPPGTISG